jgi:hypothetical protein
MSTIRVGRREVWVNPETKKATPAMIAVIHKVNDICHEEEREPIFGRPEFERDTLRDWEHYPEADIIHIRGEQARLLDPTIRIVPRTPEAERIFDAAWQELHPRIALIEYATTLGMSKEDQKFWIKGWKDHNR